MNEFSALAEFLHCLLCMSPFDDVMMMLSDCWSVGHYIGDQVVSKILVLGLGGMQVTHKIEYSN